MILNSNPLLSKKTRHDVPSKTDKAGTGANKSFRLISLAAAKVPEDKMTRRELAAVKTDLGQVAVLKITFRTSQ